MRFHCTFKIHEAFLFFIFKQKGTEACWFQVLDEDQQHESIIDEAFVVDLVPTQDEWVQYNRGRQP